MTTQDLSTLSEQDLEQMNKKIQDERQKRHQERLRREIEALKNIAKEKGFLVDEIFVSPQIHAEPKYRHPEDAGLTWSGKGRRPDWLNDLLKSGRVLDEMRIT